MTQISSRLFCHYFRFNNLWYFSSNEKWFEIYIFTRSYIFFTHVDGDWSASQPVVPSSVDLLSAGPFIYSLFSHLHNQSLRRSFVRSVVHSVIRSFVPFSIPSSVHSLIISFIHYFICDWIFLSFLYRVWPVNKTVETGVSRHNISLTN